MSMLFLTLSNYYININLWTEVIKISSITANSIHERIAYIRKYFNLSQQEFGQSIGVTYSAISLIERKKREPSDRVIRDICREYKINENWIRSGVGEIFIPEDMTYLYNVGKLGNEQNEFKKFYLNLMMGLPDDYWNYIYEEFKKFDKTHEHP